MKKKVLILGSSGMLGHIVYHYLDMKDYDVLGTSRTPIEGINSVNLDVVENIDKLFELIQTDKPEVIINCVGLLVKASQDNPTRAIFINSLFPRILVDWTKNTPIKIIHISTDCIFNGKEGPYNEYDQATESNYYGRTKALGEINNNKDLTIRTSIIGPELKKDGTGLFNWVINQEGIINGFTKVFWNGVTTLELAKQIEIILRKKYELNGIYHLVTPKEINKYNLLKTIQDVFDLDKIQINKCDSPKVNKVLINNRTEEYCPKVPNYDIQLKELKRFMGGDLCVNLKDS